MSMMITGLLAPSVDGIRHCGISVPCSIRAAAMFCHGSGQDYHTYSKHTRAGDIASAGCSCRRCAHDDSKIEMMKPGGVRKAQTNVQKRKQSVHCFKMETFLSMRSPYGEVSSCILGPDTAASCLLGVGVLKNLSMPPCSTRSWRTYLLWT